MSLISEEANKDNGAHMKCVVCGQPIVGLDIRSVVTELRDNPDARIVHPGCKDQEAASSSNDAPKP